MPEENNHLKNFCSLEYYSPQRLAQYYHHIKAVRESGAGHILEVGIGAGVVAHILRRAGLNVLTCDTESELEPDIIADVRKLPLADGAVDFALCCQVLEHLPFEEFSTALQELCRVTRGHILISIPCASHAFFCNYKLPGGRQKSWVRHWPRLKDKADMTPGHYWEMGRSGYPKSRIVKNILSSDLRIIADFTPAEAPHNQFFLLATPGRPGK